MGAKERRQLRKYYEKVEKTHRLEELPWHQDEPPGMLQRVVEQRPQAGRALDIGCGAGTNSIYLAQKGYDVVGVDFLEQPARITRERADRAGVQVKVVEADIVEWSTTDRFDLILDAGCLHGLRAPEERQRYRAQILEWLADDGDYVLTHFVKRHPFDWRPIGPARIPRDRLAAFFAPELAEQEHGNTARRVHMPLPLGPVLLEGAFWFRRA